MSDPHGLVARRINKQREAGWPDFHPETYCHRCGQRNVHAWSVDSVLWNEVAEPHEILCPQCFTEAYQAAHPDMGVWWGLTLRPGQTALKDD